MHDLGRTQANGSIEMIPVIFDASGAIPAEVSMNGDIWGRTWLKELAPHLLSNPLLQYIFSGRGYSEVSGRVPELSDDGDLNLVMVEKRSHREGFEEFVSGAYYRIVNENLQTICLLDHDRTEIDPTRQGKVEIWLFPEDLVIGEKFIAVSRSGKKGAELYEAFDVLRRSPEVEDGGERQAWDIVRRGGNWKSVYIVHDDGRYSGGQSSLRTDQGGKISSYNSLAFISSVIEGYGSKLFTPTPSWQDVRDTIVKSGIRKKMSPIMVLGTDSDEKRAEPLVAIVRRGIEISMGGMLVNGKGRHHHAPAPLVPESTEGSKEMKATIEAGTIALRETYLDIPFEERFGTMLRRERLGYLDNEIAKGGLSEEKLAEKIRKTAANIEQEKLTADMVMEWEYGDKIPDKETYKILEKILIDDNRDIAADKKDSERKILADAFARSALAFESDAKGEKVSLPDSRAFSVALRKIIRNKEHLTHEAIKEGINAAKFPRVEEDLSKLDNNFIFMIEAGGHIPSPGLKNVMMRSMGLGNMEKAELNTSYLRSAAAMETSRSIGRC